MEANNKLIERTIENINKRKNFEHPHNQLFSITDFYIKNALERYEKNEDIILNSRNFIRELEHLLQLYEKKEFITYFRDFIKNIANIAAIKTVVIYPIGVPITVAGLITIKKFANK